MAAAAAVNRANAQLGRLMSRLVVLLALGDFKMVMLASAMLSRRYAGRVVGISDR